ncbi:MAG: Crp/Fnr family transcriptional regulator [Flavipsychrobacter sp.]
MQPHIIQHIAAYADLSDAEIQLLGNYLTSISVAKKEYLLKEGQICRNLYFVERGCLRMYFINDKGTEQTTQFAIENWWLADYMSYDRQQPSQFHIQAIEHSEVYTLDHKAQNELIASLPQIERYFRLMLQKAYAASQMRIKYLYELSREEGYRHFAANYPAFVQRIPQYMLASYLGFTPEYLSELRKKYANGIS